MYVLLYFVVVIFFCCLFMSFAFWRAIRAGDWIGVAEMILVPIGGVIVGFLLSGVGLGIFKALNHSNGVFADFVELLIVVIMIVGLFAAAMFLSWWEGFPGVLIPFAVYVVTTMFWAVLLFHHAALH